MPLSEEELRLLEQMERALVAEDPKLASTMRGTTLRATARRRALIAGVVFLVGIVVLMTGAVTQLTAVGIIGFVVMLGSAYVALSSWNGQSKAPEPGRTAAATGHPSFSVIDGGRTQEAVNRRRAQPPDLAGLDDGALRGALAPPSRPERRLLTRSPQTIEQPTSDGRGPDRVRPSCCVGPAVSALRAPGRRPAAPAPVPGAGPAGVARRARTAPRPAATRARDRRWRPAPARSAATQASTSARTWACVVAPGGRLRA